MEDLAMAAARAGNKDALQITLDADVDPDCRDASGNTLLLVAAHGGHTDCVMALLQAGANVGTTNLKGEGILHICFANGWTSLGTTVAAIQNESTYWTTLADEHGVDSEAVLAAMDLGLDLKIFESSRAPSRANTATKKLSSSARFLDCISNEIMSHDLASDTNHSSDRHRGGSNRLPQVPILQLSGHGGDSDSAKSRSGERPHPVPGLQLPTHGEIDATISIAERELALSALEARQAEAEMYTDAELGRGQGLPHASDTKKDKKKRGKLRIKHRNEDLEGASNSVPAQRSAHVSESILLIGKSQAAFESNHAKMTRAQQEATDLDREIQQQLDEGLLSAALNGDVKGIRSWLEKGALVDAKRADTGDTAMHIAASAGNKKMCKALLRECAVLDLKNVYGQTAPDVAFRKGHAELGGYLKSKENMQSEEQTEGGNHQDNSEYVFESHQVDQIVNNESVAHADADNMFEGLGGGEDVSGTIDSRHSSSKLQSTVQGDVKGMMRQLRLLGMTTYPQDFDRHSPGWGSGRYLEGSEYDVHDSTHALDPLSLAEDYDDGADYDVLKCAEEFLQTVSPVNGKGAFTDLDLLLEEADKAMRQGTAVEEEEQEQEEEEEEYDTLEQMARILRKNPGPPRTILTRITTEEDREEVFRRRGLELVQKRRAINQAARPRILNGAALVICISCEPQEDGLSTHEQFASDILVLEKALPLLGFEYVDVKKDLTRAQIMDTVFETCQALCPGGNLQDSDSFLLLIMSTGGPTSFDSKPVRGANKVAQGACQIGFQEIINLVKVIPDKPKMIFFNVCGDPEERKRANFDVPLHPSPCVPNLYQEMLDGCDNVLLVLNVTSGKLNWVPRAGSLFLRFLLEEINDEGVNKDLADLVIGVRTRLLEYFFARRGTGKPNCRVGRAEYDKFFLQTPLFTEGTSDCPIMFGPALKFAKELCGANFIEQKSFLLINIDTIVVKDELTDKYVHGYGVEMPRTCEGVEIDLENGTPNLGWQFVVHAIDDSEEVYIGAAVLPKTRFTRVPSFGRVASNVSNASSVINSLKRVSSNASHDKGIQRTASNALKRVSSTQSKSSEQRTGSAVLQRIPSSGSRAIQRAPSFGRVPSRAEQSWSVSADGRVNPDIEGHGKCGGFSAGSVIEVWHNREKKELEFTVDGKHIQKVWKDASLGELLVPAVSIGPSTTATLEISHFWSW